MRAGCSWGLGWRGRTGAVAAVLAVVLLTLLAAASARGSNEGDARYEEEYLLLPWYRGEQVGDLVPAVLPAGGPALVVAAEVLDAILAEFSVSDDGAIAGRRHPGDIPFEFAVDGRWHIDGRGGVLDEHEFRVIADELYLSTDVLARVFPLDLAVDTILQRLDITSTGPLPIDLARDREARRGRLRGRGEVDSPPLAPFPYAALGRPAGDLQVTMDHDTRGDGDTRLDYDGLLVSELAWGTGLLFFRGDDEELSDARLRLGRESAVGGAYGVPSLVSAFAGDVNSDSVPLVGSLNGRGVAFSAYPLGRPDSFDETTVEGDAPVGWEVELYRRDELLAFARVGPDGRYRFAEVPILFGRNELRLLFIGPDGQVREETREFNIGGGMTPPGTVYWQAFAGEHNERLLSSLLPDRRGESGGIYALDMDVGLGRHLSAGLFASRAPENHLVDSELVETQGGKVRASFARAVLELDAARQSDGGSAWHAGGATAIGRMSISARHGEYDGFRSRRAVRGVTPLERESRARISLPVRVANRSVGLDASGEKWDFVSGGGETVGRLVARFSAGGVYFNQEFEWRERESRTGQRTVRRSWLPGASMNLGRLRVALDGRYDLDESELERLQVNGNWRIDEATTANFGITRTRLGSGDRAWSGNVGVSRDFGPFRGSVTVSRGGDDEYFVGLGVNISFGVDRDGNVVFSGTPIAERGAADVFVYHDQDNSGDYDPAADEIIPAAGLSIDGARRAAAHTGDDGRVFMTSLATRRPVTLDVDPESIPDPFLTPADGAIRFVPRPGQPFGAEIALVDSGELTGYLVSERNGEVSGLSNVVLELVRIHPGAADRCAARAAPVDCDRSDSTGAAGRDDLSKGYIRDIDLPPVETIAGVARVVRIGRTQFDGSFLFDLVAPGRYLVRVRDGQSIRGAPLAPVAVAATVTPEELFVDDLELRLLAPEDVARRPDVLSLNDDSTVPREILLGRRASLLSLHQRDRGVPSTGDMLALRGGGS